MPMFSKNEKYENIERSKLPIKLFKKNKTLDTNIDVSYKIKLKSITRIFLKSV